MFWHFGSVESLLYKRVDSLHLRQSKCPVLLNNIGCAWPFRRNPCLATWLTVRCSTGIDTCQGFITSSFSSSEPPAPLSQRSHGTRIRLSRAKAPPAKGGWIWEQKCYKLWSGFTTFLRRPHEVLQDPGLRLNASYYITKQILPPLNRVFSLIGLDVFTW